MMRIKCPKCETILAVDAALAGTIVLCSQCSAKLRVPALKPAPASLTPGSTFVKAAPPAPLPRDEREMIDKDGEAPIELEFVEEGISPEEAAVLTELERLQYQQPGWGGALAVLVVSVLLYMGAARVEQAWDGIFILIPVLAFHELGHYVAMRCFGYRNLRMFFIPFLGAAVTGRHYNIAGWKKTLVALAGPLPGILIGAPLGLVGLLLREPKVVEVALLTLILNGFNLLPFLPLDGGWVVHAVLFVRHPVLDVLFRLVAALGLLGLAILLRSWVLIAIAVLMLFAMPMAWRLARIAHRLKQEGLVALSPDAESIPAGPGLSILAALRPTLPPQTSPKILALNVANVFETLNAHPPGGFASLGLLVLHAGGFLVALGVSILLVVLPHRLA